MKARRDVVVITAVQFDREQGCSSTRNTQIVLTNKPALEIAGIGLSYRVATTDDVTPWSRVTQSFAGTKWISATILATFAGFQRIDSVAFGCYKCGGSASRHPLTGDIYCDLGCTPEALSNFCVEVTATVDVRVDAGPDVITAKVWPNEFPLVTGAHMESFSKQPAHEQVDSLNTRFKNHTFAMHVRIRENPNTQYSHVNPYQANIVSLDLPPEFGFFGTKRGKRDDK
ncbi:hypothetical protein KFL_015160010 [Klebsormidium nitens]|uniref:Uncharacterized protein n=1 Tax=Klebsormidium nitens TaxID=105231 RepID=A0A1Y1IRX6_KLENI|nr:hypothetical protein KFL_015160010 [Klebsormidium nitens]|eukprot:GAQ93424.1 hypothetical protein KFL_015160010 [Klebsormidium nitens]